MCSKEQMVVGAEFYGTWTSKEIAKGKPSQELPSRKLIRKSQPILCVIDRDDLEGIYFTNRIN